MKAEIIGIPKGQGFLAARAQGGLGLMASASPCDSIARGFSCEAEFDLINPVGVQYVDGTDEELGNEIRATGIITSCSNRPDLIGHRFYK